MARPGIPRGTYQLTGRSLGWMGPLWLAVSAACDERDTPVFVFHEVEDITAACNEEHLHEGVIYRYELGEEVDITRHEDCSIESLCLEG